MPVDPILQPYGDAWDCMQLADQRFATRVYVNFAKAIAAYEFSLVSKSSPFDQWADAGFPVTGVLPPAAVRGARLFVGKAACADCHSSPLFTDDKFHAIGVPRKGEEPLILDFATSIVAEGKVLVASQGGKKLPGNALVSPDGSTSGDPRVLYGEYAPGGERDYRKGEGAIRAFGEHKGSGLAFMVELLGGSLTGTGAALEGRRWANGMLSLYLDPAQLDPEHLFAQDVNRYVAFFKSSRPMESGGEVLVPGEPEARTRRERLAAGIPLPDDTWASIVAAARAVGLGERRIGEAAGRE